MPGEISVSEKGKLITVAPKTHHREYMREEYGDRDTPPSRIWRKSLSHGDQ